MVDSNTRKFAAGDIVKSRAGAELKLGTAGVVGKVIAAEYIDAWGCFCIMVQRPGGGLPWSWEDANLFDLA